MVRGMWPAIACSLLPWRRLTAEPKRLLREMNYRPWKIHWSLRASIFGLSTRKDVPAMYARRGRPDGHESKWARLLSLRPKAWRHEGRGRKLGPRCPPKREGGERGRQHGHCR